MKLEDAVQLASYGLKIVPVHFPKVDADGAVVCSCNLGGACPSIGKHPIPPKWTEAASSKPEDIKAWWRRLRNPNAGVVTGARSGVVVLDIDPRHKGDETLDDLQTKYGKLPDTAMVITGSGGEHYYFKHPGAFIGNGTNLGGPGVDFRGDGGFVVAPGSLHFCGGFYEWEASSTPVDSGFAEMPKWLFDLCFTKPTKPTIAVEDGGAIVEGGRNVWLTSLAGAIRRRGCGYKPIAAAVWYANLDCCSPPLSRDECEQIVKSILRYAPGGAK